MNDGSPMPQLTGISVGLNFNQVRAPNQNQAIWWGEGKSLMEPSIPIPSESHARLAILRGTLSLKDHSEAGGTSRTHHSHVRARRHWRSFALAVGASINAEILPCRALAKGTCRGL